MADLILHVARIEAEARDVVRLELVSANGAELPSWEPGAPPALPQPGGRVGRN